MKKRIFLKRLCCLMMAGMLTVLSGAESTQAAIMTWVDVTDFKPVCESLMKFESYAVLPSDAQPFDGKYSYKECIPKGATVYIQELYTTCTGQYNIVNYEGKAYYLNKSAFPLDQVKKRTLLKRKTKADVVKKKGLVGDVLQGDDYGYIYALPDDSKPANCYACAPAGTTVEIVNANYNKNWMKILIAKSYVAYIKKSDVITGDAYLAGAQAKYQPYIKLAKKAKLTYSGILKDYNKTLTKKELCRLAVLWYQAMGNKLPKQKTASPFTDTKDKYVIMAHQLGIIKSTSNKKFSPDEALTEGTYNEIVSQLMKVTDASADACAVAKKNSGWSGSKVPRDEAIARFYKALVPSFQTKNLVSDSQVGYMIAPFDNQNVCLDVWEESKKEGAVIGLWDCKGSNNQRFMIDYDGGNYSLKNVNSLYTLSFSGNKVYQRLQGYKSQIITLEYNSDGTVCIRNGYGQYLDIEGGTPVSGGTLTFKEKSGSSSQKFVFKF